MGMRVLFVDDDKQILDYYREVGETDGVDADYAADVKEANQLLQSNQYDMVCTDFNMPGEDGSSLVESLRQHDLALPIIVISGMVGTAREACKEHQEIHYLAKPFRTWQLIQCMKTVWDGRKNRTAS